MMKFLKSILCMGLMLLMLSGCVVNKQCRKVTLVERAMSSELCDSFVAYHVATIYGDEIEEKQRAVMILSHEEYVKIFVSKYGEDVYNDIGYMYFEECIRPITLNFIKAIQSKNILQILQLKKAYEYSIANPVYILETTKNLKEDFSDFNEDEFNKTMDKLKKDFIKTWKSLTK